MMRFATAVCLIACGVAWSERVTAQISAGGSVRGFVKDVQDAALPGARVTATSEDAPTPYTVTSDETGYYRLLDLPPGQYTISVELDGFAKWSRDQVDVRAGLNINIPVTLRIGAFTETVSVVQDTPMLESTTAATAVNVSGEFQRRTPLSSRGDWAQFFEVTPGVSARQSLTLPNYSFHGSSPGAHVIQVDGVDVGSAQSGGNQWFNLSSAAVQDVRISTGGTEAAAPLGLGAVVSLVTPSGTNRFRATAAYTHQGRSWNATNSPGGTSAQALVRQSDLSIGGPIAPDRATFFVAHRYERNGIAIARTQAQLAALRRVVPDFVPFDNETEANYSFIKLNAKPSANHQLTLSHQRDRYPIGQNTATFAGPFYDQNYGGPAWTTMLASTLGRSMTARVTAGYNEKGQINRVRNVDQPARTIFERVQSSGAGLVGNGPLAVVDSGIGVDVDFAFDKLVISADVSHYRTGVAGSHEVKVGAYLLPRARSNLAVAYANGGIYAENYVLRDPANAAAGRILFQRRLGPSAPLLSSSTRAHDYAAYVQDVWSPHARITASAGVRVDWLGRHDQLFDRPILDSTEVGPRFGLRVALTDSGNTAARASWGVIHEALSSTATATSGSVAAQLEDQYDLNLDGVFDALVVTPGGTALAPDRLFDPSLHQGYVRELALGLSHQFPGRILVDGGWMRRDFRELPTVVEVNGIYDNGTFGGFRNPALAQIGLVTNNRYNSLVYSDFTLQASMRRARHQLLASYVRQWRHVSGTWQPNDPASIIQPGAFANDRGLDDASGRVSGIYDSYFATPGVQWRDHLVRIAGTFDLWGGFMVASNLTAESGRWSGPITTTVSAADPRFGPPRVTLSNGSLVPNPLATTTRFAFPTRGEGQLKTPALYIWSIRTSKGVRFGRHRIELAGTVYNVTNNASDQTHTSRTNTSTQFGQLSLRQAPRAAQATLSWAF